MLSFTEYQSKAKTTAMYLEKLKAKYELPEELWKVLGLSYVGLGLGEVGEIQNKLKKVIRDCGGELSEEQKEYFKKEVGDCIWYLAMMCEELGADFGDVAQANLDKLASRKERGVLAGSGDNR